MDFKELATVAEGRMIEIRGLVGDHRPAGLAGVAWDVTAPLRERFPQLQRSLSSGVTIPTLDVDAETVRAARQDGTRFGREAPFVPAPLAKEGARFLGHVEQATGRNLHALYMAHCQAHARTSGHRGSSGQERAERTFADPAACERFVVGLVDRTLGVTDAPLPGVGTTPTTFAYNFFHGLDGNRAEEFADASGRVMYCDAWATREEEEGRTYPGQDLMDTVPETPDEAVLQGARLCGRIEAANGVPMGDLFRRAELAQYGDGKAYEAAVEADDPRLPDFEHFAHDLTLSALGHGVSWFDDRPDFPLELPRFEYVEEAGLGHEPEEDLPMSPSI